MGKNNSAPLDYGMDHVHSMGLTGGKEEGKKERWDQLKHLAVLNPLTLRLPKGSLHAPIPSPANEFHISPYL